MRPTGTCRPLRATFGGLFTLLLLVPPLSAQQGRAVSDLAVGDSVVRLLAPGDTNVFRVRVSSGQRLHVRLTIEKGVVQTSVFSPVGTLQLQDLAWPRSGMRAAVDLLGEVEGWYRIEVTANLPDSVGYRLTIQPFTLADAAAADSALSGASAWLQQNAHPVSGASAGRGFSDLKPLDRILAGVRVIGLGEPTHGQREFEQVKHRLTEYLVQGPGPIIFALESSQTAAKAIDDYVTHGTGSPEAVLAAQGFWNWDTQEVAAMLEWMRDYNRAVPDERKVHFAGIDFQLNPGTHEKVVSYLARVAPERVAAADSALAHLVDTDPGRPDWVWYYGLTRDAKASLVAWVNELLGFLTLNDVAFIRSTSPAEFAEVLQRVRLAAQLADTHSRAGFSPDPAATGFATRDRYMAENLLALLDAAPTGARIVLSAHNQHIRRQPFQMGYYIGQALGNGYYAMGMSFDQGSFQAKLLGANVPQPRPIEFTVGPALQGSVGWFMKRAGVGDLFVDFRAAPPAGAAARWFAQPLKMRSIGFGYFSGGSGYDPYVPPLVIGASYDGILFIEQTTRARGVVR